MCHVHLHNLFHSLKAVYLICNEVNKIQNKENDPESKDGVSLIKGLLKGQLNEAYFKKLQTANAVQLSRINALNGIISNYLSSQRNYRLKMIMKQNNASLIAQAVSFSNKAS